MKCKILPLLKLFAFATCGLVLIACHEDTLISGSPVASTEVFHQETTKTDLADNATATPTKTITDNSIETELLPTQTQPPTLTPTSIPTPTPFQVTEQIIPQEYIEQTHPDYIRENADGSYTALRLPEGAVEGFTYRTDHFTSFFILPVNPGLDNIGSIRVSFSILKDAGMPSGRNFFIGTLAPSLAYPDESDGQLYSDPYYDEVKINVPYQPEFMEYMDRYMSITEHDDSSTHYELDIPYDQFRSGRTKLLLRFLPDVKFSDLEFVVMGYGVNLDLLTELPDAISDMRVLNIWSPEDAAAVEDEFPYAHIFLDNLWNPELGEDYNFIYSDILADGDIANSTFFYSVDAFTSHFGAVEIWTVPVSSVEYLTNIPGNPDILPEILSGYINVYWRADRPEMMPFWKFIENEMMDPETNLVTGVWADYPVKAKVQPERRTYANLGILDAMLVSYSDSRVSTYLDPLLSRLAEGIATHEILEINGDYYYVPEGINPDGSITVRANALGYAETIFFVYEYLAKDMEKQELADKMLRGYANSLQLMLVAQEDTPSNLLPERITVNFGEDGTHSINYDGEFYIGNTFFFSAGLGTDGASAQFGKMTTGLPNWLTYFDAVSYTPGSTQQDKWENYEAATRRYDAAYRILNSTYRILYNVYTFQAQDGRFASRYTLDGQAVEFADGVLTTPGTPGEALGWYLIGAIFHDNNMQGRAQYIIATGMGEMENYFSEQLKAYPDYNSFSQDRTFFRDNKDTVFARNHLLEVSHIYTVLLKYSSAGSSSPPFGQEYITNWEHGDVDQILERVRMKNVDVFGEP